MNYEKAAIREFQSYVPEPQMAEIVLNANENPYDLPEEVIEKITEEIAKIPFNRYPDPGSTELIKAFAGLNKVDPDRVVAGNGLDEILSYIISAFIGPGDVAVTHEPTFSMYEIWTKIAGGDFYTVPNTGGKIDVDALIKEANDKNAKIVFVCSPNNPTGEQLGKEDLKRIVDETKSLIVLDEAYVDFSDTSYLPLASDRMIVLRTLSKAYRFPAGRCGFAVSGKDITDALRKVKGPYNLNALTQTAARVILENSGQILDKVPEIVSERDSLYRFFKDLGLKVFPSKANFLYVLPEDDKELQKAFLESGILIKYYPGDHAFRFTVGTPEQNKKVKQVVKDFYAKDTKTT